MDIESFPIIHQLNQLRAFLHNESHKASHSFIIKSSCWIAHKPVSVVALPANLAGIGVSVLGAATTACTLGAFKVAVYALSLGNIELKFSTGFLWFAGKGFDSTGHVFKNIGELIFDSYHIINKACKTVQDIAHLLGFGGFIKAIFRSIANVFSFVGRRIELGFDKASQSEFKLKIKQSPVPTESWAKKSRLDWAKNERSFVSIIAHTAVSTVNVPLNAAAFAVSTVAWMALNSLFVGKALVYAGTNVNIPLPTGTSQASKLTYLTGMSVVKDVGTIVADPFITTYKVVELTGIASLVGWVAKGALSVVAFIPKAIFT